MRNLRRVILITVLSSGACTLYSDPAPVTAPPPPEQQPPPPSGTYVPPPPQAASGIQIVAGSYGQSCGAPRGNKTEHLAQSCNGRDQCAYKIDYTVIGDPTPGCGKDYIAEWRCGDSPNVYRAVAAAEAGYGTMLNLGCAGGTAYQPPPMTPPPPQPIQPQPTYVSPQPQPTYVPPPPPGASTITIVAGTYGRNCRAEYGNKTQHLAQSCNGQVRCAYKIDYQLIGDPAYGCQKDYVAEWRCGNQPNPYRAVAGPEAGFGTILTLACDGSASPTYPPPMPAGQLGGGAIQIVVATYGANCGATRSNVTAHLAQSCNNQRQCNYSIDYKVLGDPAYGCKKDYRAEWRCGNDPRVYSALAAPEAGNGSVVSLRCP